MGMLQSADGGPDDRCSSSQRPGVEKEEEGENGGGSKDVLVGSGACRPLEGWHPLPKVAWLELGTWRREGFSTHGASRTQGGHHAGQKAMIKDRPQNINVQTGKNHAHRKVAF